MEKFILATVWFHFKELLMLCFPGGKLATPSGAGHCHDSAGLPLVFCKALVKLSYPSLEMIQ